MKAHNTAGRLSAPRHEKRLPGDSSRFSLSVRLEDRLANAFLGGRIPDRTQQREAAPLAVSVIM